MGHRSVFSFVSLTVVGGPLEEANHDQVRLSRGGRRSCAHAPRRDVVIGRGRPMD
jgi:hypothetical protein